MNKIQCTITRNKETGEWGAQLVGPWGSVILYKGKNADTAHDLFDEIIPIVEGAETAKASYTRLKDESGDTNWVTALTAGEKTVCLKQFGKRGADQAVDFCQEVAAILNPA